MVHEPLEPDEGPGRTDTATPRPHRVAALDGRVLRNGALTLALVAGLVVGGLWSSGRTRAALQGRSVGAASAIALDEGYTVGGSGSTRLVDFRVGVFNIGLQPLTVVESAGTPEPTSRAPDVRLVRGSATVAPGHDVLVLARVPVDCSSDQPVSLRIPTRGKDGAPQQLTVQGPVFEQPAATLCPGSSSADQQLSVAVAGSLAAPALVFTNVSERALTVLPGRIAVFHGPFVVPHVPPVDVLVPALPLTVAAHGTARAPLWIKVLDCGSDLGTLTRGGYGELHLDVVGGHPEGPVTTDIDVGALVGAAFERTCRR